LEDISPMNQKFRYLEHTADAKFEAYGRTLEEAFANAALATASLMWDTASVEKKVRHPVSLRGRDLEQLLVHFLQEIIYLLETQHFFLASADGVRIEKDHVGYALGAVLRGDTDPAKYQVYGEVKAITYNEMKIQKKGHYTVQVVVDL
jgi:SHS2 domain-containing protein